MLTAFKNPLADAMIKVTETFRLLFEGKNNQYIRFASVVDELTKKIDTLSTDAKGIKDHEQLRAVLEEIQSTMKNVQIQARKLDEYSGEKNTKIKQKIAELEKKLQTATNELAIKYDNLTKTSQFQTVKDSTKAQPLKPGELSLDDLLGCIEEETSNALGTVNFKSDLQQAETAAKTLQATDPEQVTVEQVADTLDKAAKADASRARALNSFKNDLAAAPNLQSSLLTKAKNVGGFRDLIRTGLEKVGLPNIIKKATEKGNSQGIALLKQKNVSFKENSKKADEEIKIVSEPEKIKRTLSTRQQAFMSKVNKLISNPEIPKKLKDIVAEMAGRTLSVLSAIERVSSVVPESKELKIEGKLNQSDLFGLAQIYSDYCEFYVAGYEIQVSAMEPVKDYAERIRIYSKYDEEFKKSGYKELFLELRDNILFMYDFFENDIFDVVGSNSVIKCKQDMIDAFKLYEKLLKLTGQKEKTIAETTQRIGEMIEEKEELSEKANALESGISNKEKDMQSNNEKREKKEKSAP